MYALVGGLQFSTYAPRGGGDSILLYISIAYYMQKEIACKIAYVLNRRPLVMLLDTKCILPLFCKFTDSSINIYGGLHPSSRLFHNMVECVCM